ncbi:MAG: TrbG/VirB9 family P-type conjugative transfer protein [Alphaproteobacteria bacterium]|nr:TrbG/VirB9 family P-type conjugative transfer protein [Alphaproteobacteria bacterium]
MACRIFKVVSLVALAVAGFSSALMAQVDQQVMDASAEQAQGNYTPMNLGYAGFNSLGMTQAAWLDPLENLGEGQSRPAYSRYYWSPDLVLPIRLREGMITLVNFPSWEMIEDIFIGDNATFDGQISGPNSLLLYPRKGANVGVDTNVIVFGRSGNRYVFYVKSEAVNTERLTNSIIDIDVIGGQGGTGSGFGSLRSGGGVGGQNTGGTTSGGKSVDASYTRRFQKSDWLREIPLDPSKFRFDLEVYVPNPDDVVIAPERVWRDDIFTYIDLGKKALNMMQRPVVSMIVERVEVPVGFRTKGPDNRLIIVEGVGDLVLRNGKRIICIKLRRSDESGLEYAIDSADYLPPKWEVPAPLPESVNGGAGAAGGAMPAGANNGIPGFGTPAQMQAMPYGAGGGQAQGRPGQYDVQIGQSQVIVPQYNNGAAGQNINVGYQPGAAANFDYSKMQHISNNGAGIQQPNPYLRQYGYGSGFTDVSNSNISIELGTDSDVSNLENLWDDLSKKYSADLNRYEPFFSVDAPADGQGKELFHLRVGPIKSLEEGDKTCGILGRNGVFCSVVRTQ